MDQTKNNIYPNCRATILKYFTLSFNLDPNKLIGYLFKKTSDTMFRSERYAVLLSMVFFSLSTKLG
jgi:hypothetical protein